MKVHHLSADEIFNTDEPRGFVVNFDDGSKRKPEVYDLPHLEACNVLDPANLVTLVPRQPDHVSPMPMPIPCAALSGKAVGVPDGAFSFKASEVCIGSLIWLAGLLRVCLLLTVFGCVWLSVQKDVVTHAGQCLECGTVPNTCCEGTVNCPHYAGHVPGRTQRPHLPECTGLVVGSAHVPFPNNKVKKQYSRAASLQHLSYEIQGHGYAPALIGANPLFVHKASTCLLPLCFAYHCLPLLTSVCGVWCLLSLSQTLGITSGICDGAASTKRSPTSSTYPVLSMVSGERSPPS